MGKKFFNIDNLAIPIGKNQIELSVFGNGFGECIVIIINSEEVLIIDSFLGESGKPIALEYLDIMGIDYSKIKALAITHWHTDHIKGAADIIKSSNCLLLINQVRQGCVLSFPT